MKKNNLSAILSVILIGATSLSLTSCQSASKSVQATSSLAKVSNSTSSVSGIKEGGSITLALESEPDHLDPYLATAADTRAILFNVFEGLVKPDKDGNLIPAVAASLPDISSDGLTYTFKIRSGIKFQNGNAVTAGDVKYSLETAKADKITGLDGIKSVDSVDSSTVKLTLSSRNNDFLAYLTTAIIPKDYKDEDTNPIGTGPFKVESFTQQQSIVLVKNTYYWQKNLPHLDKVTLKIEADANAQILDFKSGTLQIASGDYSTVKELASNSELVQANSNSVQQLNLNNAVKPFNNVKVRQAISYAVDPDEIIQTVSYGKGVRVGTPVIPGFKKYYDDSLVNAYKKDTAKAKKLLSEAGYPNGFSFTITVASVYPVHVNTAQVIINELKEIGVTATIKQVDWATWLSQVYTNRQYESTIISVDGTNLTPESYLGRYVSTDKSNFFNYKSASYDALYKQAVNETNDAKRVQLFKQAQELISKDAANVFIQDISGFEVLKSGITGYTPYPLYVTDLSNIHYTK